MKIFSAAYVSTFEFGSTFTSLRYPMAFSPRTEPSVYWPRTAKSSSCPRGNSRSARSTFTFSSRTASASNATGGSMATREQLQHVVLDDVARDAGRVEIPAALLDADRFGDGQLHVIDV